jgi:fluoride exporter
MLILMVALGGALGAWARYQVSGWVFNRAGAEFPWGTLTVNVSGSFLLGLLLPLLGSSLSLTPGRAFVEVGCIGAFTTFSTFAFEAVTLIESGESRRAALYVLASLGLGLGAIVLGFLIAARIL